MDYQQVITTLENQIKTLNSLNDNYETMIIAQETLIKKLNSIIKDYENQLEYYWNDENEKE